MRGWDFRIEVKLDGYDVRIEVKLEGEGFQGLEPRRSLHFVAKLPLHLVAQLLLLVGDSFSIVATSL